MLVPFCRLAPLARRAAPPLLCVPSMSGTRSTLRRAHLAVSDSVPQVKYSCDSYSTTAPVRVPSHVHHRATSRASSCFGVPCRRAAEGLSVGGSCRCDACWWLRLLATRVHARQARYARYGFQPAAASAARLSRRQTGRRSACSARVQGRRRYLWRLKMLPRTHATRLACSGASHGRTRCWGRRCASQRSRLIPERGAAWAWLARRAARAARAWAP